MMKDAIISNLHTKFAEKTWNDTFQLVRRCMEKSRDESKPCEPLVRALERIQKVLHASSLSTIMSRLEMIAKQQGMGFHITESTCYLTADLFYVEVLLLPCGEVQESSKFLLHLLRSQNFADFSVRLRCLFTQYDIPGDNEMKLKLLTSLQHLWKDLQLISDLQKESKQFDSQMDLINYGKVGLLITGKEDFSMALQFYAPPTDVLKASNSSDLEPGIQAAQVTVGLSNVTLKLPMASVILQPPALDPQGCPVFAPLSEVQNETFPACFLLRLQPPIPLMMPFVEKLRQITDIAVPDAHLQGSPLPQLLVRSPNACWKEIFTVPSPGGPMHSCIFPEAAWDVPTQKAVLVDRVPFTQPAHIPSLLELLRHQCAINTLLRTCTSGRRSSPGEIGDLPYEVLPESSTSFSVTFHRPHADSLAVLMVSVPNPRQITCKLFGVGICDLSLDEHISTLHVHPCDHDDVIRQTGGNLLCRHRSRKRLLESCDGHQLRVAHACPRDDRARGQRLCL
ncbi:mediator of RNA polymerase II transcription subunit 1-like isoform X5 [Nothobranchius furzeri]|uniref:mediator of RNA polymerase II transcription subunit 1-like isoform X5 n=1 Tax=Nothobranchius furzeri TaxID=105023 RepID=UPI00390497A1